MDQLLRQIDFRIWDLFVLLQVHVVLSGFTMRGAHPNRGSQYARHAWTSSRWSTCTAGTSSRRMSRTCELFGCVLIPRRNCRGMTWVAFCCKWWRQTREELRR